MNISHHIQLLPRLILFRQLRREVWEYLGQSSSLLSKLARFLKAVPLDERTSITQCLCISGNGGVNEVHQSLKVSKRMTGITGTIIDHRNYHS